MKLDIETIKSLEKGKIYWLQIDCSGLSGPKTDEKIQETMEKIGDCGIKFIVTTEDGTIREPLPLQEDDEIPLVGKYKDKTYIRTVIHKDK